MAACFLRSKVGPEVQVSLPPDIVRAVLSRCDSVTRPQTFLFHRAERHLLPTLLALYEKFQRAKVSSARHTAIPPLDVFSVVMLTTFLIHIR